MILAVHHDHRPQGAGTHAVDALKAEPVILSGLARFYPQVSLDFIQDTQATGDDGADFPPIFPPSDDPYITQVGGTTLTTSGAGGAYVSETAWNWGNGTGSSGGTSTYYGIPGYQLD